MTTTIEYIRQLVLQRRSTRCGQTDIQNSARKTGLRIIKVREKKKQNSVVGETNADVEDNDFLMYFSGKSGSRFLSPLLTIPKQAEMNTLDHLWTWLSIDRIELFLVNAYKMKWHPRAATLSLLATPTSMSCGLVIYGHYRHHYSVFTLTRTWIIYHDPISEQGQLADNHASLWSEPDPLITFRKKATSSFITVCRSFKRRNPRRPRAVITWSTWSQGVAEVFFPEKFSLELHTIYEDMRRSHCWFLIRAATLLEHKFLHVPFSQELHGRCGTKLYMTYNSTEWSLWKHDQ